MENKSSGWCNVIGVICYIMGVSLATTLIFIPVAIYCFIGGSRYFGWANMSDVQLVNEKKSLRNWAIFVSIIGFPIGLISIIPYFKIGNKPVVTDVEIKADPVILNTEKPKTTEETKVETKVDISIKKEEPKNQVSNKEETIAKLKRFKDEGLITEQEFKKAVAELNKEQ